MIALAAAAALTAGCAGQLCQADTLAPYFAKAARAGQGGRPVHVVQIGDSHTAGDAITGAWRDLLQQRYGSGGRGVLPPGRPYNGYLTRGIAVTMSPGWKVAADFGSGWSSAGPPLGLSAFTLTSQSEGASMALVAEPQQAFDRFTVCAIARPGAGSLTLQAGAERDTFDLASATERPECRTVRLPAPATNASLAATGGPVSITSWATFRDAGGIVLSNLGVVGSQLVHFARTSDEVMAEELRAYQPDLIVLAFGTNEGFAPRVSAFEYEVTLRNQIGRLRRLAGNVPILLLGAPDALTRRAELRANSGGEAAASCGATPAPAPAEPAKPGVIAGIIERLRESVGLENAAPAPPPPAPAPPAAARPAGDRSLFPPAGLATVREVQRNVARSLNVAFWDWEARMGGRCTADAWVHATPPLMRGDYVHYTSAGGRELAARLQADLDQAAGR